MCSRRRRRRRCRRARVQCANYAAAQRGVCVLKANASENRHKSQSQRKARHDLLLANWVIIVVVAGKVSKCQKKMAKQCKVQCASIRVFTISVMCVLINSKLQLSFPALDNSYNWSDNVMHWLDGISLDDNLISGRPSGSQGEHSDSGNQRKSTQSSSPTKASRLQYIQKHPQIHPFTTPYWHPQRERELLERLYLAGINWNFIASL